MSDASRREFLETAGMAAAAPAPKDVRQAAPTYRQSGFAPQGAPRRITDDLYVFEDTCM